MNKEYGVTIELYTNGANYVIRPTHQTMSQADTEKVYSEEELRNILSKEEDNFTKALNELLGEKGTLSHKTYKEALNRLIMFKLLNERIK